MLLYGKNTVLCIGNNLICVFQINNGSSYDAFFATGIRKTKLEKRMNLTQQHGVLPTLRMLTSLAFYKPTL